MAKTDSWWSDVEAAPKDEVASLKRVARRYKAARWVLVGVLVWAPLATLAAATTLAQNQSLKNGDPVELVEPGRAEATVAVTTWLVGDRTPLPGGVVVSYDGAQLVPWVDGDAGNDGKLPGYDLWVHTFTVAASDLTSMFTSEVTVAVSDVLGVVVVSAPSLIPVAATSTELRVEDGWPGFDPVSPSQSVRDALTGWVKAYTSGDPTALRLAVGDGDPDHGYVPLAGVVDAVVDVRFAGVPAGDRTKSMMVVAVTLTVSRDGALTGVGHTKGGVFDVDVLVVGADTAAPRVVAWGGPGTGGLLVPYQNAVLPSRSTPTLWNHPNPPQPTPTPTVDTHPAPNPVVTPTPTMSPTPTTEWEAMD